MLQVRQLCSRKLCRALHTTWAKWSGGNIYRYNELDFGWKATASCIALVPNSEGAGNHMTVLVQLISHPMGTMRKLGTSRMVLPRIQIAGTASHDMSRVSAATGLDCQLIASICSHEGPSRSPSGASAG